MEDHLRGLDPKLLMITEVIIGDIKERICDTIFTNHQIASICSSVSAYLGNMSYEALKRISENDIAKSLPPFPGKSELYTKFIDDINEQLKEKMGVK